MEITQKSFLSKFKNKILGYLYSISRIALLQQKGIAIKEQTIYLEKLVGEAKEENKKTLTEFMDIVHYINKEIPKFDKEKIEFFSERLTEREKYITELQNHQRLLWVENKRLENYIILNNIPLTDIVPEVQPLVIVENHLQISRSFTSYNEEEKRILLTLLVKPVSIEEIATNASVTENKVKNFIRDILKNSNRVNNKFGEKFKIVKYLEGEEIRFMLLFADTPTLKEAEEIDLNIVN